MEKPTGLRVLVVDDEFLIRWSVSQALSQRGHSVWLAEDGASALRTLSDAAEPPDVVVLDFRLPDSDDFSLLAAIKRHAPASPVIFVTAHGSPDLTRMALERGAYAVVGKPFDVHELEDLIIRACRR